MFASPEYSHLDILKYFAGVATMLYRIWPNFFDHDLYKNAVSIDVPLYFFVGRHDYNTPWSIVLKYKDFLKAPVKKLIWFEKSAHAPNFEEPEEYARAMSLVKKETYNNK